MNRIKSIRLRLIIAMGTVIVSCQPMKKEPQLLYNSKTITITPDSPVLLAGFANRQGLSDTVHHALLSRCVVLRYDTTRVCIVASDLMEIAPEYAAEIRQKISEATGVPVSHIVLSVSHTHSAPIMDAMGLGWSEANEAYKEKVIALISENAIRTLKDSAGFVACSLSSGKGMADINTSRRSIDPETGESAIGESDAAVDREVTVLQFRNTEGHPLSTWFNYACHPVALGFESRAVSPDFVGQARTVVEEKWGGNALFLNGAAGDINPRHGLSASLKLADSIGTALGQAIVSIDPVKDTAAPGLKLVHTYLQLPYRDQNITPAFIDEQVALKSAQKTEFVNWRSDVKKWGERMKAAIRVNGALPNYRGTEVSVLKIGSSVIVYTQGEFFNSYQVRMKEKFPQVNLVFAGYSNGESGYVPDGASFKAKGYEVDQAYIYIHEPSPLTPETEQIVMTGIENLIRQVL